jgi:hypothetical protein
MGNQFFVVKWFEDNPTKWPDKVGPRYTGQYKWLSYKTEVTVQLKVCPRDNTNSIFSVSLLKEFFDKQDLYGVFKRT